MNTKPVRLTKTGIGAWSSGAYSVRRRQCDDFFEYLVSGPNVTHARCYRKLHQVREAIAALQSRTATITAAGQVRYCTVSGKIIEGEVRDGVVRMTTPGWGPWPSEAMMHHLLVTEQITYADRWATRNAAYDVGINLQYI